MKGRAGVRRIPQQRIAPSSEEADEGADRRSDPSPGMAASAKPMNRLAFHEKPAH